MAEKIRRLTIVGYILGSIIVLGSLLRWFIIYDDPSQAIVGASIGVIFLGFTYIYQRLSDIGEEIKDLNSGIDALNIWTRGELETLEKKWEIKKQD